MCYSLFTIHQSFRQTLCQLIRALLSVIFSLHDSLFSFCSTTRSGLNFWVPYHTEQSRNRIRRLSKCSNGKPKKKRTQNIIHHPHTHSVWLCPNWDCWLSTDFMFKTCHLTTCANRKIEDSGDCVWKVGMAIIYWKLYLHFSVWKLSVQSVQSSPFPFRDRMYMHNDVPL